MKIKIRTYTLKKRRYYYIEVFRKRNGIHEMISGIYGWGLNFRGILALIKFIFNWTTYQRCWK